MCSAPAGRPPREATYEQRGVSPDKPEVRRAIAALDPGLFPGAFCKALPDVLAASDRHCVVMHADGVGTKAIVAYLLYARHRDPRVFRSLAQDSLVMNLDDVLCVGARGPFVFSNTVGRNAALIPGDALEAIIGGYDDLARGLSPWGVKLWACGGETADVGDLVRTVVIDSTITTRMLREDFVNARHVRPGHVIVGLASFGRAAYESAENSGIGTNGFTALRHALLTARYRDRFPETFGPEIADVAYAGDLDVDDLLPGTDLSVGAALLSPTRTYAPIVSAVLAVHRAHISAMFHNTGGGQTKCLHFGEGVRYEKDDLFEPPPIFEAVRRLGGLSPREMFRVFNMGHRFEIVCDPAVAPDVCAISASFGVAAKVVGRVKPQARGRSLVIAAPGGTIEFGGE